MWASGRSGEGCMGPLGTFPCNLTWIYNSLKIKSVFFLSWKGTPMKENKQSQTSKSSKVSEIGISYIFDWKWYFFFFIVREAKTKNRRKHSEEIRPQVPSPSPLSRPSAPPPPRGCSSLMRIKQRVSQYLFLLRCKDAGTWRDVGKFHLYSWRRVILWSQDNLPFSLLEKL